MRSFEDRLWGELLDRHGALLTEAPIRVAAPARSRLQVRRAPIAAFLTALAAALVTVVIGLTSGGGTAAYAVVRNPDGTVTVTIRELVGVSGANQQLMTLGIPVRAAAVEAGCSAKPGELAPGPISPSAERPFSPRIVGGETAVTIRPGAIPAGDTLLLVARQLTPGTVRLGVRVYRGQAPSCVSPSEAPGAP
jgi:hypothetical protein